MRVLLTIAIVCLLASASQSQDSMIKYDQDSLKISGAWKPEKFWKKSSDQVLKLQVENQGSAEANIFFQLAFFHEGKRVEAADVKLKVPGGKKAKGRNNGLVFKPDYSLYTFKDGFGFPLDWEIENLVSQR